MRDVPDKPKNNGDFECWFLVTMRQTVECLITPPPTILNQAVYTLSFADSCKGYS